MHKKLLLTGLVGLTLLGVPTLAEARGLPPEPANFTLEVALTRAIRNNPTIQAAEAKLRQARLEKENQDLWWARTLRANANYNVLGTQGGMAAVTPEGTVLPTAAIGVGFDLGDLLAGPKNSARAQEAVVIAEAELRRTTLEVAANVTAAYQEYQAAKEMALLTDDMMAAAETDAKLAERQFARGQSAANNVLNAKLAVQRVRADRVQLTGNVAKAWTNLLGLMGTSDWVPGGAETERKGK
jgi:outer membrane protein TolC